MILKTEAFVLKSFDFRETSRIATFFTKEHGKVSGVLKGIRRDPKKFGSSLELFSVNDIVFYQYRNSDLHLISQCDLKQFFFSVRQDLKKSLAAHYIVDLVNAVMPAEEKNQRVYTLMTDFFQALESAHPVNALVHFFQIKILQYSGFKPHLDTCVKCRRRIRSRARFSLNDGGLVCDDCRIVESLVHYISPGSVASILHIEQNSWEACLRLKLSAQAQEEIKYTLNHFLVYHLGRRLKSEKFLSSGPSRNY